jgi:nucleotide-binding universal stress UspA family protein
VHVVEEQHLLTVLRYHHLAEVMEGARSAARTVIDAGHAGDAILELDVLQGTEPDAVLEAARAARGASGIVIGRAARSESHSLVRLGRVARRMVRSTAAPVIVVPPDWEPGQVGDGPVAALTNLGAESADACRFAADLAGRLKTDLALVHVAPVPEDFGAQHIPFISLEKLREDYRIDAEKSLSSWVAANGFQSARTAVLQGAVVESAIAYGEEQRSPLLVCGSRGASRIERAFLASTAAELAALAAVPVAVVPAVTGRTPTS